MPDASQQLDEFVCGYPSLAEDSSQRSAVNLPMIGNYRLSEGVVAPHDDVAAMLSPNREADFLESAYQIEP
jgi:hypothetical protein